MNLVQIGQEKSFEIVDERTTHGWTTESVYTISSPGAFGSGEVKKCRNDHSHYI